MRGPSHQEVTDMSGHHPCPFSLGVTGPPERAREAGLSPSICDPALLLRSPSAMSSPRTWSSSGSPPQLLPEAETSAFLRHTAFPPALLGPTTRGVLVAVWGSQTSLWPALIPKSETWAGYVIWGASGTTRSLPAARRPHGTWRRQARTSLWVPSQ